MASSDLCQSLNSLAEETWDHLLWGLEGGFGQPDERAFTDHHLIELLRRHPDRVSASKFDQHREAETAADAEWWLGGGQNYLGMRLQAKKLDLATGSYVELGHHVGESTLKQLDQLIASSEADGCLPLYLFYNGPTENDWPADHCDSPHLTDERRGCTVALASDVRETLKGGAEAVGVDELAQISLPWQCLTCCPMSIGRNSAERALEVLGRYSNGAAAAITGDPPSYVRALISAYDAPAPADANLPGSARVMVMTID